MIVPERIGRIQPKQIAIESYELLKSPDKLQFQKNNLQNLRGETGAVEKITSYIIESIKVQQKLK